MKKLSREEHNRRIGEGVKLSKRKRKHNPISFGQTATGEHFIQEGAAQTVRIDVPALSRAQLRDLMTGMANIMQSIAAYHFGAQ